MFVDALDEHDGNHRDLISILVEWAQASEAATLFQLRLCVAGRPENVFKIAFRTCPGFAIQDHTTNNIRHYTEDRIGKEQFGTSTEDDIKATAPLVNEIVRKANGVFLWVTLVVNEMVEGLCEGDTITELRQLLSEIPQELEDLYTRAIRRIPRKLSSALGKHKYEVYVVFQIAMHAQNPLSISQFMGAVFCTTYGESSVDDIRAMSQDQLERPLNSKSAGLLETVPSNDPDAEECVQFIHQTTKEYMSSSSGQTLLMESLSERDLESGTLFILRYLISRITSNQRIEKIFGWDNFPVYAKTLETRQHVPAGQLFEPVMDSRDHLDDLGHTAALNNLVFARDRWPYDTRNVFLRSRDFHFVMYYLLSNLSLSLRRYIANHRGCIDQNSSNHLFLFVFAKSSYLDSDTTQILIEANVDAEISDVDFRKLMDFANRESSRPDDATMTSRIQALCGQLQERRNKRSIHIESES